MIIHVGELGITLDTENNRVDCKLQYRTPEGWQDYIENGGLKFGAIDIGTLPPGQYRHVSLDA